MEEPLLEFDASRSVFESDWTVCYPRLVSDGTLFDAMRVATALGTGPESLLPLEAEAAEEWLTL
ncbi:hypothetical protein [Nonomuraea sp. NPDC049625]|uniref:hypothetical protein n=1 Tax=Nonomuraea sp. NPDC049625 TaxID=3155775 RepID=UPI00343700AD